MDTLLCEDLMGDLQIQSPDNSICPTNTETLSEPENIGIVNEEPNSRSLRRKRANSLHSIQNKIIKKRKNNTTAIEFKDEKETRKFYLNINKNIKVKPILLETIFEHDETMEDEEEQEQEVVVKTMGKPSKRVLNICDGFNINKSLINKRKNLIKKKFGSRRKPKKVALAKFMEEFKKKQSHELSD